MTSPDHSITCSLFPPHDEFSSQDLKQLELELWQREQYLTALADIQRSLLLVSAHSKDWYIPVMQRLREVAKASRVYIFETTWARDGQVFITQKAESCSPDVVSEIDNPTLQNLPLTDIPYLGQQYLNNQIVSSLVCDLPEPSKQHLAGQGILSVLGIPFLVKGKLFGIVGFDNCLEARRWSSSEIKLLTSATMAIALTQERLQAEQAQRDLNRHYQAIFEQSTVGVVTLDATGKLLRVNAAHCQMLGYEAASLVGRDWSDFIVLEDQLHCRQAFDRVVKSAYAVETFERRYVRRDGAVRWVHVYLKSVFTEPTDNQQPSSLDFVMAIATDITDRKTAELELARINQHLETLVMKRTHALQVSLDEKEVLLKEVHHRVKNNLQIISSLLQMQARRSSETEVAMMLRTAQNRVKSMALLHEQLYSTPDLANIDLANYCQSLGQSLLDTYSNSHQNIALLIQVAPHQLSLNLAIPCGLILTELMSNALKYAFIDRAQGKIHIQFERYAEPMTDTVLEPMDRARLTVGDDGVGLPSDWQQRSTLGRIIVEDLVAQLNGSLTIKPPYTGGCEFIIEFPIVLPRPAAIHSV
jgi:PAS domain S-box-containing protein